MANWYKKAAGEMSKLRNYFSRLGWNLSGGSVQATYSLDSSRVDYVLARELYHNTNDKYKLGAGFSKAVINTTVGFMGIPKPFSEDQDAQEVLKTFFDANVSKTQRTLRNALREGDCFVWITRQGADSAHAKLYPEADKRLVYNIIPPEQVKSINRHPLTNEPTEYILSSTHKWTDENDQKKTATVEQRITAEKTVISVDGDVPPDIKEGDTPNSWGFIPIVHFKNESEEHEGFGKSDLEAIEPFLKAYHDVLMHAIQGSKLHSTPRLKLTLNDVKSFLQNNFGVDDPAKFVTSGGSINLDGHELIFLQKDEQAEFIEVKSATGDASELLKFLFYCIVDTSETPEFAFGVHTPSALASVKEQMPILIRRISRKREHFVESFDHLCRIILAMTSASENKTFATYTTVLEWDDIDPRSGKDIADEMKTVIEGLNTALTGGFISIEAAVDTLSEYIEYMNKYLSDDPEIPGERERIMHTRLAAMQLEDGQFNDEQQKAIDDLLKKMSASKKGDGGDEE